MLKVRRVKLNSLKCFANEPVEVPWDFSILLIVGPNNSGKSTLLRAIHKFVSSRDGSRSTGDFSFQGIYTSRGSLPEKSSNLRQLLAPLREVDGHTIWYTKSEGSIGWDPGEHSYNNVGTPLKFLNNERTHLERLAKHADVFRCQAIYLRSEKDVKAEPLLKFKELNDDGSGATMIFRDLLNGIQDSPESQPRELIEVQLLNGLNSILSPSPKFTRVDMEIIPRESESDESCKIRITDESNVSLSLDDLGSGVKSVLLILLSTIVSATGRTLVNQNYRPDEGWLGTYLFLEEPENNLHPAAQRRLAQYLMNVAKDKNVKFFVTSHSGALLSEFTNSELTQSVHVSRKETFSTAKFDASLHGLDRVIRDLGSSPGDLLLANGLVWVEGPSDRIFLRKWIDLWSHGQLREGIHYQFLLYGGALLSHYDPLKRNIIEEAVEDTIDMLTIGMNHYIVCDKDSHSSEDAPKKKAVRKLLKNRVAADDNSTSFDLWITKGKEIENYLPADVVCSVLASKEQPESLLDIPMWGSKGLPGWVARQMSRQSDPSKVQFAISIVEKITLESQINQADWRKQIGKLCSTIVDWQPVKLELCEFGPKN